MTTLTEEQRSSGLILRTARKPHTCNHFTLVVDGTLDRMGRTPRVYCETPIRPGDRYLEYLGESPAFHSGSAYCAEHALAEWGVKI
jgi:hypothetical protein